MNSPVMKQTCVVSSIFLTTMGHGMLLGFTSCLLPALRAPDSSIQISLEVSSWLVASYGLGNLISFPMAAVLMDQCGRRIAFGISLLPAIVGIIMTFAAKNVTSLICARTLTGLTGGATATLGAVAIGEYCSPRYRGMFFNIKTAMLYLGSLVVHALGNNFKWRTVALTTVAPYALALIVTCTWPESPHWLAQKKQFSKSEQIFYRLRGTTEESVREIKELIDTQTEKKESTYAERTVEFIRKFKKRNFLEPVVIFIFAAILLEASGRHIFPAYATQIIVRITGDSSKTFVYTVAVDVIFLVSALFASYLIKIIKLRKLLFTTGAASCIVLALACLYLYLESKNWIPNHAVIPMCLFSLYFVLTNLGCALVPLALMGEIFPLEHKAVGASVAGYLISIFMTITLKIIPYMLLSLEIYGTFAVLALCTALTLFALYFILPETKNRTLQEIEMSFIDGRIRNNKKDKNKINMQMLKKESLVGN